jgi:thiol:disulfide interchange protein DsbD
MLQVVVRTASSSHIRIHRTLSGRAHPTLSQWAWLITGLLTGSMAAVGLAAAHESASNPVDPLAPPHVVHLNLDAPADPVRPGGRARAVLSLHIEHGWHVNAHQPLEDFLIATEVALDENAPAELVAAVYPQPDVVKLAFSEEPMAVYEGTVLIGLELKTPEGVAEGELTVPGMVTVQACNDAMCLPPTDVPFEIGLKVSGAGIDRAASPLAATVTWTDDAKGPQAPGTSSRPQEAPVESKAAGRTGETGGFDTSRGLLLTFLLVFAGGLALNLTPCVYPMIPITISIFGGQSGGPKQSLRLAIFYVLGMALMYSALGTVAALTGSLLGSALQNPLVLVFIAAVMVVLALSMFGLYDITVPQSLSRIASGNRQGALGALLMGATVGIIAAPCIGPFVLGLLTYVGTTGNPALGFSLFFTLALGLGLPFLVLATASGSLAALPRSGSWMVWVKKVFGFILLGMALYFLTRSPRLVPESLFLPGLAALSLIAAVVLAVLDHTRSSGGGFRRVKRATGLAGVLLSAGFLIAPRFLTQAPGITWADYNEEALAQAADTGRPVIIDFSATWCIPCKELDHWTFAAPSVVERARAFVTLKADLTDSNSPAVRALKNRYRVLGVPTVVFLAPDGTEIPDLRITGVIAPEEFLARMDHALGSVQAGGA